VRKYILSLRSFETRGDGIYFDYITLCANERSRVQPCSCDKNNPLMRRIVLKSLE
jgi:hypothetical protein